LEHFSGEYLKQLRKDARLTQKQLAEHIGISRETVLAIEKEYPKTIESLSITVLRQWWETCSAQSQSPSKKTFAATLHKFFKI
jgi:HTH-type transcriptional regulator/antitoxin HipB